jgi:ABC-type tungstate transport system substrate-binding protein
MSLAMLQHVSITLDLPVDGNGNDYARAIFQAISRETSRGGVEGADALAGLLAAFRLSSDAIGDSSLTGRKISTVAVSHLR